MTLHERSIRNLAASFAVGAAAALVFDTILRNALAAAESPVASSLTPWWVVGRVFERSVWIVLAVLLWIFAPAIISVTARMWPPPHLVNRSAALEVVGRLMLAVPLLWMVATWLIVALRITLAGSWEIDGQTLLTASPYNNVLLGYLPWAAGGLILLALSRHVVD